MDELHSSTAEDLRRHIGAAITRRLDAHSLEDRARAGDDLLRALDELDRRGYQPYLARAREARRV